MIKHAGGVQSNHASPKTPQHCKKYSKKLEKLLHPDARRLFNMQRYGGGPLYVA